MKKTMHSEVHHPDDKELNDSFLWSPSSFFDDENNNEWNDDDDDENNNNIDDDNEVDSLDDILQRTVHTYYNQSSNTTLESAIQCLRQMREVYTIPWDNKKIKGENNNDNHDYHHIIILLKIEILVLQAKYFIVKQTMGSMAQCRGNNGDLLREAGAIDAILSILHAMIICDEKVNNNALTMCHYYHNGASKDESSLLEVTVHLLSSLPPVLTSKQIPNNQISKDMNSQQQQQQQQQGTSSGNHDFVNETKHVLQQEKDESVLDLAIICICALRDLACGSAMNRAAILNFSSSYNRSEMINLPTHQHNYTCHDSMSGVQIISYFIRRYHGLTWEDILSIPISSKEQPSNDENLEHHKMTTERGKKELRLLTNIAGVIRNATHATKNNCIAFHNEGITDLFIWRLKYGNNNYSNKDTITLPDVNQPWREACFRIASSLINMAEKCSNCATQCGEDFTTLYLLIESWGGVSLHDDNTTILSKNKFKNAQTPMLHLGLAAILHVAKSTLSTKKCVTPATKHEKMSFLLDIIEHILQKETARKLMAQRKEIKRKELLAKKERKCII